MESPKPTFDDNLQAVGKSIGNQFIDTGAEYLETTSDVSIGGTSAIARRLAFRFSVEVPRRTLTYFIGRLGSTFNGDMTSLNLKSLLLATDSNAKSQGFLQLFYEFHEFLGAQKTPGLKKWLKQVEDPSNPSDLDVEELFLPRGYFKMPEGAMEMLQFVDDMIRVLDNSKASMEVNQKAFATQLKAIGGPELIEEMFPQGGKMRYKRLSDEETVQAHYVCSAFLANLKYFKGDLSKAHGPIRKKKNGAWLSENNYEKFLHSLKQTYKDQRKTVKASRKRVSQVLTALNAHIMDDGSTIELNLNRQLGPMLQAMVIHRCDSETFAKVLAGFHRGLTAQSIYDPRSKTWGCVLPLKSGTFSLDESFLLLRNIFSMSEEHMKLNKQDCLGLWDQIQGRWEVHFDVVEKNFVSEFNGANWALHQAALQEVGFGKFEHFQAAEKLCYDRIASLLSNAETENLIAVIEDLQWTPWSNNAQPRGQKTSRSSTGYGSDTVTPEDEVAGSVELDKEKYALLLRKLYGHCGIHATLVFYPLLRILPFVNCERLRVRLNALKKHQDINLSIAVKASKDRYAIAPKVKHYQKKTMQKNNLLEEEHEDELGPIEFGSEGDPLDFLDVGPGRGARRAFLRDLPPGITEEDIRESMKSIGDIESVQLFGEEHYDTSESLKKFVNRRVDLLYSKPKQTGAMKMMRKGKETPVYAVVQFAEEAAKSVAMHPALKVFGIKISSYIESAHFPQGSIVAGKKNGKKKKKAQEQTGAISKEADGDGATDLVVDSVPIKISTSSQITCAEDYTTLKISKIKVGKTKREIVDELFSCFEAYEPGSFFIPHEDHPSVEDDGKLLLSGNCLVDFQSHDMAAYAYDLICTKSELFDQPIDVQWDTKHKNVSTGKTVEEEEYADLMKMSWKKQESLIEEVFHLYEE